MSSEIRTRLTHIETHINNVRNLEDIYRFCIAFGQLHVKTPRTEISVMSIPLHDHIIGVHFTVDGNGAVYVESCTILVPGSLYGVTLFYNTRSVTFEFKKYNEYTVIFGDTTRAALVTLLDVFGSVLERPFEGSPESKQVMNISSAPPQNVTAEETQRFLDMIGATPVDFSSDEWKTRNIRIEFSTGSRWNTSAIDGIVINARDTVKNIFELVMDSRDVIMRSIGKDVTQCKCKVVLYPYSDDDDDARAREFRAPCDTVVGDVSFGGDDDFLEEIIVYVE